MLARTIARWLAMPLLALMAEGVAEVVTDGTLGPARALPGPDFVVDEGLGRRAGNNLFHSFQRFSIQGGESATFTGSPDIQRVISRVTGGSPSVIDGRLRSEIGGADFYFINPRGLWFGPGAVIDVPAGFHVAAADQVVWADGTTFDAGAMAAGVLSTEAPEGFGFRGAAPGHLTIDGSELLSADPKQVTLAGGEVALYDARFDLGGGGLRLAAQGEGPGRIATVGGALPAAALGDLSLERTAITIAANGGGSLDLTGGRLALEDSQLRVENLGSAAATGAVRVAATDLRLADGARIDSHTRWRGTGVPIAIQAGTLVIDNPVTDWVEGRHPAGIASTTYTQGEAGALTVAVDGELALLGYAEIHARTLGAGAAAAVEVAAGSLRLDGLNDYGAASVGSLAEEGASGRAGDVRVTVDGRLSLHNYAFIFSDTIGQGPGGTLEVRAGELFMDGWGGDGFRMVGISSSTDAAGDAGRVEVLVDGRLEMLNAAVISSSTYGPGNAGEVHVRAGEIWMGMPAVEQVFDLWTSIQSEASNWVWSSSGQPGDIRIEAGHIHMEGESRIRNWSFSEVPPEALVDYRKRSISIQADSLTLKDGAVIDARALGNTPASDIALWVDDQVHLKGDSAITTASLSGTDGGDILLHAGSLVVEQSEVSTLVVASGDGDGGAIDLSGGAVLLRDGFINTSVYGSGDGGDIRLTPQALILDLGFIQANTEQGARGGDIRIETPMLIIPADQTLAVGGDARQDYQQAVAQGINVIQAAAPEGVSGQVSVPRLTLDLSGALLSLRSDFIGLERLSADPCAGAGDSSLTRLGRGTLPDELGSGWHGISLPPVSCGGAAIPVSGPGPIGSAATGPSMPRPEGAG